MFPPSSTPCSQGVKNTLLRALDFLHIERTATPHLRLHRALSHSHNNFQAPTIAHRLSNGHLHQREAPHQRLQERQPARSLRLYERTRAERTTINKDDALSIALYFKPDLKLDSKAS